MPLPGAEFLSLIVGHRDVSQGDDHSPLQLDLHLLIRRLSGGVCRLLLRLFFVQNLAFLLDNEVLLPVVLLPHMVVLVRPQIISPRVLYNLPLHLVHHLEGVRQCLKVLLQLWRLNLAVVTQVRIQLSQWVQAVSGLPSARLGPHSRTRRFFWSNH